MRTTSTGKLLKQRAAELGKAQDGAKAVLSAQRDLPVSVFKKVKKQVDTLR